MRIDCVRILVLAAAFAASHCTTDDTVNNGLDGSVLDSGKTALDSATPDADAVSSETAAPADTGVASDAADTGLSPDVLDTGSEAGACLANTPAPVGQTFDCAAAGVPAGCMNACNKASDYLAPKVMEAAATCLKTVGTATACAGGVACGKAALLQACSDPTAVTACATHTQTCATADAGLDQCAQLLSGVDSAARALVLTVCGSFCGDQFVTCIESSLQPD